MLMAKSCWCTVGFKEVITMRWSFSKVVAGVILAIAISWAEGVATALCYVQRSLHP